MIRIGERLSHTHTHDTDGRTDGHTVQPCLCVCVCLTLTVHVVVFVSAPSTVLCRFPLFANSPDTMMMASIGNAICFVHSIENLPDQVCVINVAILGNNNNNNPVVNLCQHLTSEMSMGHISGGRLFPPPHMSSQLGGNSGTKTSI